MHGLVHVAHKMDEYLQRKVLLRAGALRCGKYRDLLAGGADHIALGQRRDAVVVLVLVDVLVVPCLGVGIVRSMTRIVEPVRPVDCRLAVEYGRHGIGRRCRKMTFGDMGHYIMSFLAPRRGRESGGKREREQDKLFHRAGYIIIILYRSARRWHSLRASHTIPQDRVLSRPSQRD